MQLYLPVIDVRLIVVGWLSLLQLLGHSLDLTYCFFRMSRVYFTGTQAHLNYSTGFSPALRTVIKPPLIFVIVLPVKTFLGLGRFLVLVRFLAGLFSVLGIITAPLFRHPTPLVAT